MASKSLFAAAGVMGLGALAIATPASAQQAGDVFARVAASRTKLVDHGEVRIDGTLDPDAGYKTRQSFHGTVTGGYYVLDRIAVEASVTTPITTNNIPAGSLAGTANLGDDEFTDLTLGASVHPFTGPVSPYVGGGLAVHLTTQERDGLAVNLNVPNAHGPYVQAGVDVKMSPRWGLFAEVRKAFYDTNATGLLPLDATYTRFANVDARAELDPLTIQLGVTAHFGSADRAAGVEPIGLDTTKWTVRGGLTTLTLADKVALNVGGAPYPGAGLSTYEHQTVSVQIGRFLTPHIAVNATVGFPPTIDIHGAGSIGPLPTLGRVTYGPTVLTLQYHPFRTGRVRPYVGVGASYMIVFGTDDGAFRNLRVSNDLGPAFEAGSDLMIAQHWGIFADVKKALLRPHAYGTFEGLSVVGKTRLDPWAFSGGVSYHF